MTRIEGIPTKGNCGCRKCVIEENEKLRADIERVTQIRDHMRMYLYSIAYCRSVDTLDYARELANRGMTPTGQAPITKEKKK